VAEAEGTLVRVQDRLRRSLTEAMKARDDKPVRTLRSALARLAHAEAVDVPAMPGIVLAIEYTPRGIGAAEVPQQELTDEVAIDLVRAEIVEYEQEAARYDAVSNW
jgi:hypothetical protein